MWDSAQWVTGLSLGVERLLADVGLLLLFVRVGCDWSLWRSARVWSGVDGWDFITYIDVFSCRGRIHVCTSVVLMRCYGVVQLLAVYVFVTSLVDD